MKRSLIFGLVLVALLLNLALGANIYFTAARADARQRQPAGKPGDLRTTPSRKSTANTWTARI